MGRSSAEGMAEATEEFGLPLGVALEWHLNSNHYPPISSVWIPAAKQAIEAANNGEWDIDINRPDGYATEELPTNSVYELVEGLHLEAFIDFEDQY